MTADPHAERVAALAEVLESVMCARREEWGGYEWVDFAKIRSDIWHREVAKVLDSPAMRDLLADERARALQAAPPPASYLDARRKLTDPDPQGDAS